MSLLGSVYGSSSPLFVLLVHPYLNFLPFPISVKSDVLQKASGTQHVLGMISACARGTWQAAQDHPL